MVGDRHIETIGALYNAADEKCPICSGFGRVDESVEVVACQRCFGSSGRRTRTNKVRTSDEISDALALTVQSCRQLLFGRV